MDADHGIVLGIEVFAVAKDGFGDFAGAGRIGTVFERARRQEGEEATKGFGAVKFAAMKDAFDSACEILARG
jgi:hypothetical protein